MSTLGIVNPSQANFYGLLGTSAVMQKLFRLIERLADSQVPVVLAGESGTGKELVARALHLASRRKQSPFVAENCAAIPENLLESVFFGHAQGAFTGACKNQKGLFEAADGGTLFLDEVADIPLSLQGKLLRALQTGEVRRVGETLIRPVKIRVVAASHRSLEDMVQKGSFRHDLFYRLQVVKLEIPPLRERNEDVLSLMRYFLACYDLAQRLSVSPEVMHRLSQYEWPGNVRELENEVRRWVALVESWVCLNDLSPHIRYQRDAGISHAASPAEDDLRIRPHVEALERRLISKALQRHQGNYSQAAKTLGLSRYGFQKKLRRLAPPIAGGERTAGKA